MEQIIKAIKVGATLTINFSESGKMSKVVTREEGLEIFSKVEAYKKKPTEKLLKDIKSLMQKKTKEVEAKKEKEVLAKKAEKNLAKKKVKSEKKVDAGKKNLISDVERLDKRIDGLSSSIDELKQLIMKGQEVKEEAPKPYVAPVKRSGEY